MNNLEQARTMLRKLRGDNDSPDRVIHDLRAGGHTVAVDGTSLVIKPGVSQELADRIRKHKEGILQTLSAGVSQCYDFWVPEEADELVGILLARLEAWNMPTDAEVQRLIGECQDAIDAAYRQSDGGALRQAASKLMKFLDTEPMKIGTSYHLQSEQFAWVLWTKRKTAWQKWVRVTGGVKCRDGLKQFAADFAKRTGLQTRILAQGELP